MTTAAASPDDLDRYTTTSRGATAIVAAQREPLRRALDTVRASLYRADLPSHLAPRISIIDDALATWLDGMTRLDEWVARVSGAFRSADAGQGARVVTVADDSVLAAGFANLAASQAAADRDADRLAALVRVLGLDDLGATIDAADPVAIARAQRAMPELIALAAELRNGARDRDFRGRLAGRSGSALLARLVALVDVAGTLANLGGVAAGVARDRVVTPIALFLAATDRAGELDRRSLDAVLAPGDVTSGDVPAGDVATGDVQAGVDSAGDDSGVVARQRAVALLLDAAPFTTATLTRAVETLLDHPPAPGSGPLALTGAALADDPEAATNAGLALRALSRDPDAVRRFVGRDDGDGWYGNAALLVRSAGMSASDLTLVAHGSGHSARQLFEPLAARCAAVLAAGLAGSAAGAGLAGSAAGAGLAGRAAGAADPTAGPAGDPSADPAADPVADAERNRATASAMRAAASAVGVLPAAIQRALALVASRHVADLAATAAPADRNLPADRLGLTAAEAGDFLAAVAHDAEAAATLTAGGVVWTAEALARDVPNLVAGTSRFAMGNAIAANYFASVLGALEAARRREQADDRGARAGVEAAFAALEQAVILVASEVPETAPFANLPAAQNLAHRVFGWFATQAGVRLLGPAPADLDATAARSEVTAAFGDVVAQALWIDDAARAALCGPDRIDGLPPAVEVVVRAAFANPEVQMLAGQHPRPSASAIARGLANDFTTLLDATVASLAGVTRRA